VSDKLDAGECFLIDLISYDVVIMPVSIDDVLHRPGRQLTKRGQHLFRRRGRAARIDDDHVFFIDYEDAVRIDHQAGGVFADDGVDAFGDLLDLEISGGALGRSLCLLREFAGFGRGDGQGREKKPHVYKKHV
jgi:hypothetical protein